MEDTIIADKAITITPKDFITTTDIYARLLAIAFAKFINDEGYREYDESDRWVAPHSRIVYTTAELFDHKFMEYLKQKNRT